MTNKPKQRGTLAESAVVRWLHAHGIDAHRTAPSGAADKGDIHIWGGAIVVEVKSRKTWPSVAQVEAWMAELERECMRVPACSVGILVVKRPGTGPARAGDWLCFLRADEWGLLTGSTAVPVAVAHHPVCVSLQALCETLNTVPAGRL